MQTVSLSPVLASALFGLAALHCGPPVAERPAPTPVYASELSAPPVDIIQESLRAPAPASGQEATPDAPQESAQEDGQHGAPDPARASEPDHPDSERREAAPPSPDEHGADPHGADPPSSSAEERGDAAPGTAPAAPPKSP